MANAQAGDALQWVCFAADQPSGWSAAEFESFVLKSKWTFASSIPQNPHEYTLRSRTEDFDSAVRYIREHGVMEYFANKPYKVLHCGSYFFWTMGAELSLTILINRKVEFVQP